MDNCEWVIDTCVLYQAADFNFMAYNFLTSICQPQHKVAVDLGGCIQREYEKCFNKTKKENPFPQKWWKRIKDSSNKLIFRSGKVSNRCNNHLIQGLCCDNDDLPFIGVASKTKDKFLVTEDSDYTSEVRWYLKEELLVRVMSIEQADNAASQ